MSDMLSYFTDNREMILSSPESAIALFLAYDEFDDMDISSLLVVDELNTSVKAAQAVYLIEASGNDSTDYNYINYFEHFLGKQLVGGTFGDFYDTIFCTIVLENSGHSYDREELIGYLIENQNPNGNFSSENHSDIVVTSMTLSLLSSFLEDERAQIISSRAQEYLAWYIEENEVSSLSTSELFYVCAGLSDINLDANSKEFGNIIDELDKRVTAQGTYIDSSREDISYNASIDSLSAYYAYQNFSSIWNNSFYSGGTVSLEIYHEDKLIYSAGKMGIVEGDDILTLLIRFCSKNDIELIHAIGNVVSINDIDKKWLYEQNGEPIAAISGIAVTDGDIITFK